jgi:glutaredoxin
MRAAWLWIPPIAWAACIFLLSSTADPTLRPPGPDTVLHAGGYGLMGFLVFRALAGGLGRPVTPRLAGAAVMVTALYGASDELHQVFVPGRTPELRDLASDTAGGVAGATGAALASWWIGRTRRSGGPAAGLPKITLYTRGNCFLCHEALEALESERRGRPFELEIRDVDTEPELARRFGEEVPVVFIDGRKAFKFRIDPKRLRRLLERRLPREG